MSIAPFVGRFVLHFRPMAKTLDGELRIRISRTAQDQIAKAVEVVAVKEGRRANVSEWARAELTRAAAKILKTA
jgi:tRNA threonylcarbamoyladenosine modification (KEOPS) complex Cgi121 subunit